MDQEAFKAAISEMDALDFCRRHLFDQTSWIFSKKSGVSFLGSYNDFRLKIANTINTNPNNVAIVGSAKYGFSMSPTKAYRNFNPETSDIDVVIVSDEMFYKMWSEIRTAIYAGYSQMCRHNNEVMLRFLVLGSEESYCTKYVRDTARTIKGLAAELNKSTRIGNPFKFRIYASWSDVELYHERGVRLLKDNENVH